MCVVNDVYAKKEFELILRSIFLGLVKLGFYLNIGNSVTELQKLYLIYWYTFPNFLKYEFLKKTYCGESSIASIRFQKIFMVLY